MLVQRYTDTVADMWRKVFVADLLSQPSQSLMAYLMPPLTEAEKSYNRRYCGALLAHLDAGGSL